MPDRITRILTDQIELAERQLQLLKNGLEFPPEAFKDVLPETEEQLQARIAYLKANLARHIARMSQN